jgi:hypothetical protein
MLLFSLRTSVIIRLTPYSVNKLPIIYSKYFLLQNILMTKSSEVYLLAESLFYGFRQETDLFSPEEIDRSGVVERKGHMTNVDGIETRDEHYRQRLSLGRQGLYFLTTTDMRINGPVTHQHISQNSEKGLKSLQDSLFSAALQQILADRQHVS